MRHTRLTPVLAAFLVLLCAHGYASTLTDMPALAPALTVVPTDLDALYAEYISHKASQGPTPFRSTNTFLSIVADLVTIDAVASGNADALKADLEALGMQDAAVHGRIVSGRLPIPAIGALSAVADLRFARPSDAVTHAGLVTSQGDKAMRADVARTTFGVDGTGLSVGVLSDSFNCRGGAAGDVTNGDLSPVTIIQELANCASGTDEGRAMLQIVHDVAPGAGLLFATAFGGQALFANNILNLANAGADVIVDDVFYFDEPMFQDGIIAQAANLVVAAGVPYFSAAGNQGRAAYQAGFVNSGINLSPGGSTFLAHDFDPGAGVNVFQTVTFPPGTTRISLQWAAPYFSVSGMPGAQVDLDIAVYSMSNVFLFGSFTRNIGGDPVEPLSVNNSNAVPVQAKIAIGKFAGSDPSLLKYISFASSFVINDFPTNSGTIAGHANAANVEAVGAAAFFNTPEFGVSPPVIETFSSRGTTPVLFTPAGVPTFDPRSTKPGIVAPDGVNTSFFSSDSASDPDTFPNFFGTSAAAPHAAAVAALLLDAVPALTPAEVYAALRSTAIDMGPPGFDDDTGFGLIRADAAIASVLPTVTIGATDGFASETGPDPATFIVTRTGSTTGPLTVAYTVGGTATAGSDYIALAGSVTIAAGASHALITVTPIDDVVTSEGHETVVVTLAAGAGYTIGAPSSSTITIADNDLPTVTIKANDANAAEASAATGAFAVTRTGATTAPLTVAYSVGGTAATGTDYTALAGSVVIPAGTRSAVITVKPIDDTLIESAETVVVTLSAASTYLVGSPSSATVTIADNDRPTVTIKATDNTATEAGQTTGRFSVTRTAVSPPAALTVHYSVSGSATPNSDYVALSGTVVIPAGSNTATIAVTPNDDALIENGETVIVTLTANAAYIVGSAKTATVTIADNDRPTVTIRATDATAAEPGSNTGTFTVTRTPVSPPTALTVLYSVSGSAVAGGDYVALSGTVVIPAGSNTATITVTPRDDAIVESAEKVIVTLTANAAYVLGGTKSATVTLNSNE
jgi:hypothetical protein